MKLTSPFIDLEDICRLEEDLTESIWIVSAAEDFQDLDNDALSDIVSMNLDKGIEYRMIMPDDDKGTWIKGTDNKLFLKFKVKTVPRQFFDFACQYQINDPGKRHRRGFYVVRYRSEYFGLEMDAYELRRKISSFQYMWNLPAIIRQAVQNEGKPNTIAPNFLIDDFTEACECMALGQNRAAVILFARCLERLLLFHVDQCELDVEAKVGLGRLIGCLGSAQAKSETFVSDKSVYDSLMATFNAINRFRIENVHASEKIDPPDPHTTEMIHRGMLVIFDAYATWQHL